ncbi:hypothetical protein AAZX31_16G134100 [Glycine max]|nr:hypothetical protein JHK87_045311 [Glycine soja]KAH1151489.1 hypothetical protein GYH30_045142 [Glycine max]
MSSNLTIEQRLEQLQKAKERAQPQPPKGAKIQRVAHHLRDRKHFTKHYEPKLISLGPIHHGAEKLQLGEQCKQRWAATYIESTGKTPQTLHKRVVDDFENQKKLFDDDLLLASTQQYQKQGFTTMEEKIQWMLFVDACALLQILEHANLHAPEKMKIKVDQLVLVMGDVLLLENQLPFSLLKLLWKNDESELMKTMKKFLRCHHWATKKEDMIIETEFPEPNHLLDLQRSIILYDPNKGKQTQNNDNQNQDTNKGNEAQNDPNINMANMGNPTPNENPVQSWTIINNIIRRCLPKTKRKNQNENNDDMVTYRNIKELKEAGIVLKSSKTRRPRDVSFSYGWIRSELKLPEIVVDDTTAATVLNLIAYEMCPDFENDYGICSYVSFLDSLIDHPDDVKALRSEQILLNSLGSDEEVANLFNTISTDLVPDMVKYADVRNEIEKHYSDKSRTWLALGYHTYFSNPWAIIAFHAAVVGLALTFVQTWYTIHPPK